MSALTLAQIIKAAAALGLVCTVPVVHQVGVKSGVSQERKAAKAKARASKPSPARERIEPSKPSDSRILDCPTTLGSPFSVELVPLGNIQSTNGQPGTSFPGLIAGGTAPLVPPAPFFRPIPGKPVAPPAIPEPGTWVTMIAGFGLIGAAVRRKKLFNPRGEA